MPKAQLEATSSKLKQAEAEVERLKVAVATMVPRQDLGHKEKELQAATAALAAMVPRSILEEAQAQVC